MKFHDVRKDVHMKYISLFESLYVCYGVVKQVGCFIFYYFTRLDPVSIKVAHAGAGNSLECFRTISHSPVSLLLPRVLDYHYYNIILAICMCDPGI